MARNAENKEKYQRQIGGRVRHYRLARSLTQAQLADLIGIKQSEVTRIEGGSRMLSVESLINMANALHVSIDALVCVNDESIHGAEHP